MRSAPLHIEPSSTLTLPSSVGFADTFSRKREKGVAAPTGAPHA